MESSVDGSRQSESFENKREGESFGQKQEEAGDPGKEDNPFVEEPEEQDMEEDDGVVHVEQKLRVIVLEEDDQCVAEGNVGSDINWVVL